MQIMKAAYLLKASCLGVSHPRGSRPAVSYIFPISGKSSQAKDCKIYKRNAGGREYLMRGAEVLSLVADIFRPKNRPGYVELKHRVRAHLDEKYPPVFLV